MFHSSSAVVCAVWGGWEEECLCMCTCVCINRICIFTMGNENWFWNRGWWQGLCNTFHSFINRPQNENNFYTLFQIHHDECWGKPMETNLCFIYTDKALNLSLSLSLSLPLPKQIHKIKSSHTCTCGTHSPQGGKERKRYTLCCLNFIDTSV